MGVLAGLLLWAAGFALRWLLLPMLLLLAVALHPPTLGALVSRVAMAVGSAGKGKKKRQELKHFHVRAISLLRLRLEGLEATVVEGGREASVLVLKTIEVRPTIKAALFSFFQTKLFEIRLAGIHAKKVPWAAAGAAAESGQEAAAVVQEVARRAPAKAQKAVAGSSSYGPFASITQDAKTWHRLVWLSKMVKLTVEDVSVEMTQAIVRAQPKPSDEAVSGQGPRFACVSGGFQSFTVAAMHVVHPRQVLSLDVNLKGLWARGVTKKTIDEEGAAFAQLAVEGMAMGIVLEPLDARPASAYFAIQGTPTVRVDPSHMPPPNPPSSSPAPAPAAEPPSPATTPGSSASSSSSPAGLSIDIAACPPSKPPLVDVGALPKRGFFSLPGLDITIVGPRAEGTGQASSRSRALRITTAVDLTWVSSNVAASPDRPAPQRPRPRQPSAHHRRHSTTGLKIIRRKTLRGGRSMDMSLSRIIQDAEREEEEDEDEKEDEAVPGHEQKEGAREQGGQEQQGDGTAGSRQEQQQQQSKVCVVPRMACREVKVALDGMPEPLLYLKEWNTEALVEVGLLESSTHGATGLLSPRSHQLPSPSSFRNLAVAAAAAAAGPTQHHPHKGHVLKTEVHSDIQGLAVHTSGGLLRWVRAMHRLALAAAPPPSGAKKAGARPPSRPKQPAAASPMVAHEATLRMGAFSFVADRLEDWEEEDEAAKRGGGAPLGLSGSGANAGRVVHPHARYEVQVLDISASSTAALAVCRIRRPSLQHPQRPFFRQRSASGNGATGPGGVGDAPIIPIPIPSSSDDEDAAEVGGCPSLLHRLGFRTGAVTALVRISKPSPEEEAARVAAGKPQRFAHLLSDVQEPAETTFRFTVASMLGESEQAVPRDGMVPERKRKPEMRVTIGTVVGEEGLVGATAAGAKAGAFVGLQFLCFPSMSIAMGEEEEDTQTATQDLLATVTGTALPTPGSGSRLNRTDSGGHMAAAGARHGAAPTRELMTARAETAFVRASFDLAIKGLQMGDVQKRTQASMKRFTEVLNPPPPASLSGPSGRKASVGAQPPPASPVLPALSPVRRGMAMHLLVGVMQVELVLSNPSAVETKAEPPTGEEEAGTFMAILLEMKDCRMSMVERHRRVPLAAMPAVGRVPSIMEMVMDAGALTMTAVAGEATGRMLEAAGLQACYEKVPAFFHDAGLKCVALAEEMAVIVPPALHLGAVIAAGTSQKAALDTAMRRWEETFHGRDFSLPRKFMPNIIRALFRKGRIRFCQEPTTTAATGPKQGAGQEGEVVMELRLTEWQVDMDMDKPNEELRSIAQRLDSDTDAKKFGSVVGGEMLIGAETLEVCLGALPSSMPMLAAHGGFRVKGMIVGAAPAPDPALCVPGSTSLTHIGWPAARSLAFPAPAAGSKAPPQPARPTAARLPPAVVFPTVKDGLAIKIYGDATIEIGCVRAVYGAVLLPLIDAVNAAVARATPPSSIAEPHPLPWWDKMRYQIHGSWLVTAQEMHFLHLTSPTYESMSGPLLEASTVSLHLSKVSIFLQRALHEFCFHNFVVALPSYAPPTEYSAWAHPPAHVSEALAALTAEEAGPQRLVGSYEPVLERHRFAVLPKLSVKIQYAWECLNGASPFKHHIQPNLANPPPTEPDADGNPPPDKYEAFRARGLRLQIDVAVSAQDKPSAAVSAAPAGPLPSMITLRWPSLVDEDPPPSPSSSISMAPSSIPASPDRERPKSMPTRSSSGGYHTSSGGRPSSARFSGSTADGPPGPPLSLRPWLIMRLDLLRWLKLVSTPPPSARGRRTSSLSSSAASSASTTGADAGGASPRRRRRRGTEEGTGKQQQQQQQQQQQRAPAPNFGRLLSGMNLQVQVAQPCVAMWPGKRQGLEGVQVPAPGAAAGGPASSPLRRMSSTAAASLRGFEGRGMLLLMRDLVIQHVTELLPGQENRSLTATNPLVSRTLLSRQDAEGVSLYLMSFLRCHNEAAWRLMGPAAAAAGLPDAATGAGPMRAAHERAKSTPLASNGTGTMGKAGSLDGPEGSPFFVETGRFVALLEALHAAREPEDFLAGTRYLEVNSDSTGKGEGVGVVIDPLKGYSLQRGSTRALSLSRSFSLDSLGSGHGRRDGPDVRACSSNETASSPAQSPKAGRGAGLGVEGQHEEAQLFRPSFASFVLNHQMMRPPPESVPAFHNTDLPCWRDPTPPPTAVLRASTTAQGLNATGRRRRSNPLLQSSSFGEAGAARRTSRAGTTAGDGGDLTPLAGPAPATMVVIVTELRILWTLAARTAVNHFSTQMTRHMHAYNGTKVAAAADGDEHSDSDSDSDPECGGDDEAELPTGLAWQDSQSDLLSGISTVYSPPPGNAEQSDLTRIFLQQKGGSAGTGSAAPSPSSFTSQNKRARSTMLGGLGGGLDMRASTSAAGAAGSGSAEGGRTQRGSGAKRKEDYRVTFKVILLYPQINFRSENANGSFIIAAKEAYMEGRKHDKLFKQRVQQQQQQRPLTPAGRAESPKARDGLQAAAPAKPEDGTARRRAPVKLLEKAEQWLRIDNVRAYVVPLDVEATREVHWLDVVPPSSSVVRTGSSDEATRSGTLSSLLGMPSPLPQQEPAGPNLASSPARPLPLSPKWSAAGSAGLGEEGRTTGGSNTTASTISSSKRAAYDFRGTAVVQEVVKDFNITFASISFNPAVLPAPDDPEASLALSQTQSSSKGALAGAGAGARRIRISSEETVGKVLLDLPQLDWNLNSRQFYITLDVVRNVLLAAPVKTEEEEEEDRLQERLRQQEEEQRRRTALAQQGGGAANAPERALDLSSKADRELLKTLVEAALQRLALAGGGGSSGSGDSPPVLHETKVVQYCVGGGTWKVKAEEGRLTKYDAVEVGFTGFSGQHVYFHDGSTDSTIQVESFWVRNLMPGPDSALFQDDVTTVMCPVVLDKQPCQRCGQPFEQDDNRAGSCVFHATEDGVPGEFRLLSEEEIERQHWEQRLRDEETAALGISSSPLLERAEDEDEDGDGDENEDGARAGAKAAPGTSSLLHRHASYHRLRIVPPTTGRWTCCGATHETAPGCRARAHVGKETMLNVRAKSHAPMTVAGLVVHPYQFLELSIFPGANYKLTIQLTRNVMELFHAYFLTQDQQFGGPGGGGGGGGGGNALGAPEDTAETKSNLLFGKSALEQKHKAAQQGGKTSLADRITKSLLGGGGGGGGGSGAKSSASPRTPTTTGATGASSSSSTGTAPSVASSSAEPVVYMKYVRFGDLNIKTSVSGFAIKLDGYRASIPAFVKQGRVLTWKRLIRKFEKHVAWSITTSAASSMVGGGKSKQHNPQLQAPPPQLLPGTPGRGGPAQASKDKEEKERERGIKALFSPPAQEDRSKLLFGGKR